MSSRYSRALRWLAAGILLVVLAVGALAYQMWRDYQVFIDQPLSNGEHERVVEVKSGDSFVHVLRRLREIGVEEGHDWFWRGLAWELGVQRRLQVGEYAVDHGITPRELLTRFERGQVIQHRFTIVPGWTYRELRQALAAEPLLAQDSAALSDAEVMQRIGSPDLEPEGQFLPETYLFIRGSSDLALLKRAHEAMQGALQRIWAARSEGLPIETPEQALILASIIEKETGVAGERREIAGVFSRRLRLGMRLQTDPTVIYGVGAEFNGNLTRLHLETDTPWNTYTRAGLPPTPIALPGLEALQAAVDPAPGETLYFVSKGDGSHHFSRTLSEHNAAVRRYQLRR